MAADNTRVLRAHWAFPPQPSAPAQARRRLTHQLQVWCIKEDELADCVLVAHELVANAVEHARTPFELRVSYDGDRVVIGVDDSSPAAPQLRPHDPHAARGRGLQMVAAIARRWDCVCFEFGKTIWAEIAASP